MWVVAEDVEAAMGQRPLTDQDVAWLRQCVAAANALIRRYRPTLDDTDEGARYGATRLATDMYERRGSRSDVGQFGEFQQPNFLTSLSYESQLFLGLGRHWPPVVA